MKHVGCNGHKASKQACLSKHVAYKASEPVAKACNQACQDATHPSSLAASGIVLLYSLLPASEGYNE